MTLSEKNKPLAINISDTLSVSDSVLLQLRSIRTYLESHILRIIILISIILANSFIGFYLTPWLTCVVNIGVGGFSLWFGYKAITKVREIKILEGDRR